MKEYNVVDQIISDLYTLGVRPAGLLMVHSSLKSLGFVPGGAEYVIQALLAALDPEGTLLMPALSYETVRSQHPIFDLNLTPSCVGIIPESFRLRSGTKRSIHPTHSVCAFGPLSDELLIPHSKDSTPCGPNSPFNRLSDFNGQILMLGCGLMPNTSMHALEEIAHAPYVLKPPMIFTLINGNGQKMEKAYAPHNFMNWKQRYDRVDKVLDFPNLRVGNVLKAKVHLIEAQALRDAALIAFKENPWFFVDKIGHAL